MGVEATRSCAKGFRATLPGRPRFVVAIRGEPMNEDVSARTAREQAAYDGDSVFGESARLHSRFAHVLLGPNSAASEAFFWACLSEWAPGADVLECGCHHGALARLLVPLQPRSLVGIDISPKAIDEARAVCGGPAEYRVMDAAALTFPADSFDLVMGRAILHHVDFERALAGVHRVLRPGGHAVFVEPLRGNPAAKLFRALTPKARTEDEAPLSAAQIGHGDKLFGTRRHFFANLLSVPVGVVSSLVAEVADNRAMRVADVIDRALARTVLRYWMRIVVLTWEKPR
jgi:SAM-dependent methyltransferase